MRHALARRRLSNRALMWLCVAALLLSLMPLYALSAYNHACYDDFGFPSARMIPGAKPGASWRRYAPPYRTP